MARQQFLGPDPVVAQGGLGADQVDVERVGNLGVQLHGRLGDRAVVQFHHGHDVGIVLGPVRGYG